MASPVPRRVVRRSVATFLLLSIPTWLHAHPGHEGHDLTWDFTNGALHPLAGIDHLLAILTFGLLLARVAPRLRWFLGGAFLAAMAAGGFAGASGLTFPAIEPLVASTVLVLGLLVLVAHERATLAGAVVAPAFAVLHGIAHGSEVPQLASGLWYGVGFITTTAGLIALGASIGMLAALQSLRVRRIVGGLLAGAAAMLLIG